MVQKTSVAGTGFIPPTTATTNTAASGSVDAALDAPPIGGLFGAKPSAGAVTQVVLGDISPQFPLDDLGAIVTRGRWAAGFSLDGGSVRLMWINARRVNDAANKQGFEVSFFLQGPAIAQLKDRLEKKGATTGTFPFYGAELAPSAAEGKDTLLRGQETWSPGGKALVHEVDGKYTVHLVDGDPEALKGAVRIRVYGDDAASTASFGDVVSKLGLQHVFVPPSPVALERLKLARFLWATQPELLEKITWAGPSDLDAKAIDKSYTALALPADHASRSAIAALDLDAPNVAKRASLALLLWETSPKAFLDWAKADTNSQHGILPASSNEYALNSALTAAGLKPDSPEVQAATAAKPSLSEAKRLFKLGLIVKQDLTRATELLTRSLDSVPPAKLHDVIVGAGIDVSGDRLSKIDLREVYPGYFTAYDPELPKRLHDVGARYLYSTLDNPERVFEVLTGGQKSSMTRFSEGRIVQGKSSAADFGTGGAFSIFTRLVTESAVQNGKKQKGASSSGWYYGTAGFNNWGGSRPYKVIINKSVLGRLDWYGYNGDNFGRSTGLKSANHAEAIVKTIDSAYSSSNELMFPVGNDPKNIDFVVCESDKQRDDLLKLLGDKGITSFNGKPIAELVRVEKHFFVHPDDMTVEAAIKEALEPLELKSAEQAARVVAEPFAKSKGAAALADAIAAVSTDTLGTALKNITSSTAGYGVNTQAKKLVGEGLTATAPKVEQVALAAAQHAAETAQLEPPDHLANNARWQIQNQLRAKVQSELISALKELGPAIAEKAALGVPPGADASATKSAAREAAKAALLGEARSAAIAKIKESLAGEALDVTKKQLDAAALSTAKSVLAAQLTSAAYDAGRAEADADGSAAALKAKVVTEGTAQLITGVEGAIASQLGPQLRSALQKQAKPKAEAVMKAELGDLAKNAARTQAHDEVKAKVLSVAEAFNAANPDKAVTLDEPTVAALVAVGLARADAVADWFVGVEIGQALDPLLHAAIEQAVQAKTSLDHKDAVLAQLGELLATRAEQELAAQLRTKLGATIGAVVDEVAAARAGPWAEKLAPGLATEVLGQLADGVNNYTLDATVQALVNDALAKLPAG